MEIILEVTQEDINKGQKSVNKMGRTRSCPLAQACKRQKVEFGHISSDGEIVVKVAGEGLEFLQAEGAWDFVDHADKGKEVQPQTSVFKTVRQIPLSKGIKI